MCDEAVGSPPAPASYGSPAPVFQGPAPAPRNSQPASMSARQEETITVEMSVLCRTPPVEVVGTGDALHVK
jgi:hypothetical protein